MSNATLPLSRHERTAIAAEIGVDLETVSRALQGRPGRSTTRARLVAALARRGLEHLLAPSTTTPGAA